MPQRPFSTDPNYVQSVRGLHRLHALAIPGKNEGPEADAVRAGLEGPWSRLSEDERQRITGLSEDLDSLSESPAEPLPLDPQARRGLAEVNAALQAGEADTALGLLRRWGMHLEPGRLSYLRGTAWQAAGDHATAALFFGHTARLDPGNADYTRSHRDALSQSNPPAGAVGGGPALAGAPA